MTTPCGENLHSLDKIHSRIRAYCSPRQRVRIARQSTKVQLARAARQPIPRGYAFRFDRPNKISTSSGIKKESQFSKSGGRSETTSWGNSWHVSSRQIRNHSNACDRAFGNFSLPGASAPARAGADGGGGAGAPGSDWGDKLAAESAAGRDSALVQRKPDHTIHYGHGSLWRSLR